MADQNLLSTPEGYATPEQIKSTYDYAKALLHGNLQQPVQHWTQGVSNMVSALVGGDMNYRANRKENEANAADAGRMLPAVPGAGGAVKPSFSEGPAPAGMKSAGDDTDRSSKAIAGIESGGDYSSVGPITKTGDKAYGKYQVMGANIPEWTQTALGKPMTADQFLADPQAQEAVFKHKFGEYTQKYGPEGAAKAWFAGEKGMSNPNAKDMLGTSVADYGRRFSTAFAGPDGAPPAVQAMGAALRGQPAGTQVAAGPKSLSPQTPLPAPADGGQIYIDPSLVQKRPQYNEGQMRGILSSPRISEQAKLGLLQQYNTQGQPIDVPYPGGVVRIDPNNPTKQQFIPEGHWGKSEIGDIKSDTFLTPDGKGGVNRAPISMPPAAVGPRSDAGPAIAPAGAPVGGPVPGGGPVNAEAAPAPPATAAAPTAPVQVASLDPAAGMATAAAAAEGGKPPVPPVPGAPEAIPVAAAGAPPAPSNPLAKMVQAAPPPGVSQQDWDTYSQKKAFDNKTALDQKAAESKIDVDKDSQMKAADAAAKKYDTLSSQAQAARKQMPNLDLGLALMSDPNFHTGLLSGAQDVWSRLKVAVGGDRMANAPNEAFDKIMAGTILDNMKTALGGLGQVRLAEISLLTKANANRTNTDASNRAVLEVSRRAVQSIDHLDELGQQYASGDEVVDPISGKTLLKPNIGPDGEIAPRHGLDAGYDKIARKFTLEHPSFSPEEIKHYESIFTTGLDPNAKTAEKPPGAAIELPPAAVQQLKSGAVTTFQNGQQWTLGPDGKPKQVK